jgi:chitodextrinase
LTTYQYTVDAFNAADIHSAQSAALPVTTPAVAAGAPNVPTGLATTSDTATSVGLSWTASTGAAGYTVYRNGTALGTTTSPSYTDSTVSPSTAYQYTVDAFNAADTHSAQSTALPVTTPAGAPSVPTGLATTSDTASSVGLSWTASTGAAGYTVYCNGTALGTTTKTSYTDATVSPSTTYRYTVDAFNAADTHSAQSTALPVTTPAALPVTSPSQGTGGTTPHGYWLVGSDGGVFSFGSAQFYGSTGSLHLQRPVVGIVPTGDRGGYWLDASDGGVFSYGDTQFHGSIPGLGIHPAGSGLPKSLNAPVVGLVPSIDDGGYFMVASDGGVFAFGDAHFAGSCPGIGGCAGSAVGVLPDNSGNGYWVVTSTGNVYAFGDAPYFGAPGHGTVTSAVATPDKKGYWILLSDGEVFGYGDAANLGSPSSSNFNAGDAAAAIFATSDGGGYWVSSALGAVFNFGDAPNDGGMTGTHLNGSIIAASGF